MKRLPRFLLLTAVTTIALHGCKARSNSNSLKAAANDPNSDAALEPYKVVDCTPEICDGKDTVLLSVAQDEGDQTIAMEVKDVSDQTVQYALDGSPAKSEDGNKGSGDGSKGNSPGARKLDQATTLANLAKGFFNSNDGKSATSQFGVATFFSAMSPMLQTASDAERFSTNNIDGTPEQRAKTLMQLKELSEFMSKNNELGAANREQLLANLVAFAGQDGWLNLGDVPRISAVVPQIASRIADQRIASEAPRAIASYSRYYRSQLPLGGLFFGGMVDRRVSREVMSRAYGMKWQAVNEAGRKIQSEYNTMLSTLGVKSYYLLANNRQQQYWDPAPQVTEAQLGALIEGMTGSRLSTVMATAQPNSNAPLLPAKLTAVSQDVAKKIVLPDGIPFKEIHRLFRASEGFKKTVFPEGLRFKTLADGRLEISRNTAKIDLDTVVSKADTTNAQGNPSQGDFSCTATTSKSADGRVSLFLYSGMAGVRLSVLTGEGWFELTTPINPQPPTWLFIRKGPVDAGWLEATKVRMRLETNDGNYKTCMGKVYHM